MVQTFILTRTFAISALVVGAIPTVYAAPIPGVVSYEARHNPRGCRIMGCLYEVPTGQPNAVSNTSATTSQTTLSTDSLQVIDFLISALTSARDSLSSSSTSTNAAAIDAVVPLADIKEDLSFAAFAEDLAASLSSDAGASPSAPKIPEETVSDAEVVPNVTAPDAAIGPAASDIDTLDALV